MSFSELKRAVGIESSGHLQFHLGKLAGLIKTDESGNYVLTDDGRGALLVAQTALRSEVPRAEERYPHHVRVSDCRHFRCMGGCNDSYFNRTIRE